MLPKEAFIPNAVNDLRNNLAGRIPRCKLFLEELPNWRQFDW
jgi:hypothetical protein